MLKLKTPPARGLDASATRILSNKRVDIFSNDNTEDFSPALKYNMNDTPSKKIKLRNTEKSELHSDKLFAWQRRSAFSFKCVG